MKDQIGRIKWPSEKADTSPTLKSLVGIPNQSDTFSESGYELNHPLTQYSRQVLRITEVWQAR